MKKAVAKPSTKKPVAKKPAAAVKKPVKTVAKAAAKKAPAKPAAPRRTKAKSGIATGEVLNELKSLAKELNKAARDLGKSSGDRPKTVASILGSVERMTMDAANKSLQEAEAAKLVLKSMDDSLSRDWSRKQLDEGMKVIGGHLTNIIVAQEFQDLAGQAIRKAMKALVGAIIVVEGGGSTEDNRLSQNEVDKLLNELMP
ncbi:MAG TPA: hypothetical protein VI279_12320 [Rhodocyclaceae bacterium]